MIELLDPLSILIASLDHRFHQFTLTLWTGLFDVSIFGIFGLFGS